jgi:O-acetyl-ADP-ribose deacetylase
MNIKLTKGDITELEVDVIVNAANSSLLGGGGVDGAIHRKGGKQILDECITIRNKQGGCKVGEAVITTSGNLPSKNVIHTVGPRWNSKEDARMIELLGNCYFNSLKLAEKHGLKTISFPNISTGVYQFPKQLAAEIAISSIEKFESEVITDVYFVCFDEENFNIYNNLINQ